MVNLSDSVVKPVKRENSNTTNATHVTGVTASTAGTHNTKNNAAFYNTQYKANGKGFFPSTTTGANATVGITSDSVDNTAQKMSAPQKNRQAFGMVPPGTAGSTIDNPKSTGGRFRSI